MPLSGVWSLCKQPWHHLGTRTPHSLALISEDMVHAIAFYGLVRTLVNKFVHYSIHVQRQSYDISSAKIAHDISLH